MFRPSQICRLQVCSLLCLLDFVPVIRLAALSRLLNFQRPFYLLIFFVNVIENISNWNLRYIFVRIICSNAPDTFPDVCGDYLAKQLRKPSCEFAHKEYLAYFNLIIKDVGKPWISNNVCKLCTELTKIEISQIWRTNPVRIQMLKDISKETCRSLKFCKTHY